MHEDHTSGASEILPVAAERVLTALAGAGAQPAALAPALRAVVSEQPAMGAVHRLVSRALEVARTAAASGLAERESAGQIEEAVRAFAADYDSASARIVDLAAEELLPEQGFVATWSRSSLVERAFLEARRRGKRCGALVAESRPLAEGRRLATTLAEAGLPVLFASDAALPSLLAGTAGILIGADAVRPQSFLHKVGTTALLLAGREVGLAAHALAQEAKFLPAEAALLDLVQRDPAQVWADAPGGVRVLNPTFEEVDLRLLRGVATERTVLPPGEAAAVARETRLDAELAKR
ncbi:MAG: hypothetical protein R3190_19600, partial [Thermoanaerobaculia bacterium]|nr:hypothetical protein [Thermoanaerobaculia bacterium]